MNSIERFWSKVDIRGKDDCWIWEGGIRWDGYGQFKYRGRMRGAHTVSWEIQNGEIPEGFCVCHNCPIGDNPLCVNPNHLKLGTHQDNMDDMVSKGRQSRKLSDEDVEIIRHLFDNNQMNQPEIANSFGISQAHVSDIVNNKERRR
ncbi:MAG: HNH endonuclease [Candidatus Izemoplasmatales bacterium]|jgi:hypothetical protein